MHSLLLSLALLPCLDAFDDCRNSLCSPGDLNGDGLADVVVAGRRIGQAFGDRDSNLPVVEARSGLDGALLWRVEGRRRFGIELAAAGDWNGDGIGDVAVANPRLGQFDSGVEDVSLLSGATGGTLLRLEAPAGLTGFGRSIASGRNLVGDPTPDLLVGARGCALLVDGALRRPMRAIYSVAGHVDSVPFRDGAAGRAEPDPPFHRHFSDSSSFARTVHALPDLDGDGLGEILIGEDDWQNANHSAQPTVTTASHLIRSSGGVVALPLEHSWAAVLVPGAAPSSPVLVTSTIDSRVAAVDPATGEVRWLLDYEGYNMAAEGATVALVGDYDGDGSCDLAHAANETSTSREPGFLSIVRSTDGTQLRHLPVVGLDENLQPVDAQGSCPAGYDVTAVADHDGDGFPELALHTPGFQQLRLLDGKTLTPLWNVAAPLAKP